MLVNGNKDDAERINGKRRLGLTEVDIDSISGTDNADTKDLLFKGLKTMKIRVCDVFLLILF